MQSLSHRRTLHSDFIDPDDIETPVEEFLREPVNHITKRADRKIRYVFMLCFFLIASHATMMYWEIIRLGRWRHDGRVIQLQILEQQQELIYLTRQLVPAGQCTPEN